MLLIGAGLMVKSIIRLHQVELGFDPENVLTMSISLPRQKYRNGQEALGFYEQLMRRIREAPGVESVAGVDPLPLSDSNVTTEFMMEGHPKRGPDEKHEAGMRAITPEYFQVMRIPVIKGRSFTEHDNAKAPFVAIINKSLSERFWAGENPLGKRIGFQKADGQQQWYEVVGVAGDVKHERLDVETKPEIFLSYGQYPKRFMTLVVRSSQYPEALARTIRSTVGSIDPDQPVFDIRTMEERRAKSVAQRRFVMLLLGGFSVIALVLSVSGIYGLLAYSVAQRRQEIGIRMALGALERDIIRMFIKEGFRLSLIGVLIGVMGALLVTRFLESLLFGVTPIDPATFIFLSALLIAVALLASYMPAQRATTVDPLVTLRCD